MLTRRRFLAASAASTTLLLRPAAYGAAIAANDEIGLGFIGLGWRGGQLLDAFKQLRGVRVVALCDADEQRLAEAAQKAPNAMVVADMRRLLDNPEVDAVVIATCNHWHCLAAIWACQAGKDVYVEKPLGHNLWEQEQLLKAARDSGRIVQVGTQQRSSPIQAQAKQFLHKDEGIGKLSHVVVSRIGQREPIGKQASPIEIPPSVDYNLWLGPAVEQPIYRDELHYDWHWDWNTGNGEMGNWGVHVIDDVLNVALQDRAGFPTAVYSAGTRAKWNDAGNTPNVQVAHYENSELPVSMILSNIVPAESLKQAAQYEGFATGYTVYGEGGRYCGQRGGGTAYDADGKVIKEFKGSSELRHQQNFLDAVRSRNQSELAADLQIGHVSTAWCNLASIAALEGDVPGKSRDTSGPDIWQQLVDGYDEQVTAVGTYNPPPPGGRIEVDAATGEVGKLESKQAQDLLRREYRSAEWEQAFAV